MEHPPMFEESMIKAGTGNLVSLLEDSVSTMKMRTKFA